AARAPRTGTAGEPRDAFPTRAIAIRMLHFPEEMPEVEIARRRLALEEFLELQLEIQRRRKKLQASARGLPCAGDNRLIKPFLKQLCFALTVAQTAVLREIRRDLSGVQPMRRLLHGHVAAGNTLCIGTHALIVSGFAPDNLGLVIIDEQQKFGVVQREQLVRKGRYPHLLVMTATPIPRTLGLTLYGDLDISVIDRLPPGRG